MNNLASDDTPVAVARKSSKRSDFNFLILFGMTIACLSAIGVVGLLFNVNMPMPVDDDDDSGH
tara:strand:+ start:929 stop:1117 length:189 start_codon:yes stop_codon:yes gene_type:complete